MAYDSVQARTLIRVLTSGGSEIGVPSQSSCAVLATIVVNESKDRVNKGRVCLDGRSRQGLGLGSWQSVRGTKEEDQKCQEKGGKVERLHVEDLNRAISVSE
jgi:hypothetical protein